jgi:hypothetical protein
VPQAYGYLLLPFGWMAVPGGAAVFPIALWSLATVFQVIVIAFVATAVVELTRSLVRREH